MKEQRAKVNGNIARLVARCNSQGTQTTNLTGGTGDKTQTQYTFIGFGFLSTVQQVTAASGWMANLMKLQENLPRERREPSRAQEKLCGFFL